MSLFFIGWHARPSMPGVLSHYYHPNVFLNGELTGKPVGEPELSAAYGIIWGSSYSIFQEMIWRARRSRLGIHNATVL